MESFKDTTNSMYHQEKLDSDYRQILRIIKPYIQTINNNEYLAKYRVWLEKLSSCKENEKFLRNQYLMELARQIQSKKLAPPFTLQPPLGPLLPFKANQWNFEEIPKGLPDKQLMCQQWTEDNSESSKPTWPYHVKNKEKISDEIKDAQKCVQKSASSVRKINLLKEIDEMTDEIGDSHSSPETIRKKIKDPVLLEVIREHAPNINPDLWEDLSDSDVSLAVLGSGDRDPKVENKKSEHFEKRIHSLMIEINGIKKRNEQIGEKCDNAKFFPENATENEPEEKTNKVSETEKSFMNTDWKKIVESLQVRLSETQQQNRELNSLTSTLHKKIKELDASKEIIKQNVKKQNDEVLKQEIEILKKEQEEKIKEIESNHTKNIHELEEKFMKETKKAQEQHEKIIKEIEEKCKNDIDEKNKEVNRLEGIVQKECTRLINEIHILKAQIDEASLTNATNDERILFLQKCITRMDRLFQKSEREYSKRIEKLKQEMDSREKAVHIQLQTQKAEIVSRCSAEKQTEMDLIVQNLERKYAKLLEMQQTQVGIVRSEDEKIIRELKAILDDHNIPY